MYDKSPQITGGGYGVDGKPTYDTAKRDAATTGTPTERRATNSDTKARVNHGVKGSQDGGAWQEHKAAYDRNVPPDQKRRDLELHEAALRHVSRTWHPDAAKHLGAWMGQNHAFNSHAVGFMRDLGTKEEAYEKSRAAARGAEKAAGHEPRPATPGHPKASTLDVRQGVMPKTGERKKLNYD